MKSLLVRLFYGVYCCLLWLSAKHICVNGSCSVLLFFAGCLPLCVFFYVFVVYERYALFGVFSPVLLLTPFECVGLVLGTILFHAGEVLFMTHAFECFLKGKVVIGVLYLIIGLVGLVGSYYSVRKYLTRKTFLDELLRLGRAAGGHNQVVEVAITYLSATREDVEPAISKCSFSLGEANDVVIAAKVISSLKYTLSRKKAFVVFKLGPSQYSYLIIASLYCFRAYDFDSIVDGETEGGTKAMAGCWWHICSQEIWHRTRDDRIGFWDLWTLFRLFSLFWEDDDDVQEVVKEAKNGITNFFDHRSRYDPCLDTYIFARYLLGLLYKSA
jgi:hypothetical protein